MNRRKKRTAAAMLLAMVAAMTTVMLVLMLPTGNAVGQQKTEASDVERIQAATKISSQQYRLGIFR
jgi:hypothetical protein